MGNVPRVKIENLPFHFLQQGNRRVICVTVRRLLSIKIRKYWQCGRFRSTNPAKKCADRRVVQHDCGAARENRGVVRSDFLSVH